MSPISIDADVFGISNHLYEKASKLDKVGPQSIDRTQLISRSTSRPFLNFLLNFELGWPLFVQKATGVGYPPRHARKKLKLSHTDDWAAGKNKFPEHLKAILKSVGIAAMKYDMFGERDEARDLYVALPSVLPYNQFTLTVRDVLPNLGHRKGVSSTDGHVEIDHEAVSRQVLGMVTGL